MAGVERISEMLKRPEVVYEIAKNIQNGACELKTEGDKLVIIKVERQIKYKT